MATATIVQMDAANLSSNQASHWANIILSQLEIVRPYRESQYEDILSSNVIDESIMNAPRRRSADPFVAALAQDIAHLLYPSHEGPLAALIQYEKDIVRLRRLVTLQRKRAIELSTKRNNLLDWSKRILKQGPWDPVADPVSLTGPPAIPMPVKIAEKDDLTPFFEHLALGGTEEASSTVRAAEDAINIEEPYYSVSSLEFEKGVLYADRRMDLCKMVVGPTHIGALLESLKTNDFVSHFLLGNNIIGPHGARCIADFLKEFPDRMDTWYLAGNCIDTASFKLLVDQLVRSEKVTNIWLKRNPLKEAAADDIFRLITQTPNLRTLDLDQTELGDAGVAALFTQLAQHVPEKPLPLRNLYLNAVGMGFNGAAAISAYLASPHCTLTSLYASNNPLGNAGAAALATGLTENRSLERLFLASTGLLDSGATALCNALASHPKLSALSLGQSFATEDLNTRYNYLTGLCTDALTSLIKTSPNLTYLSLDSTAIPHSSLSTLLYAVGASKTMTCYIAKTILPQSKDTVAVYDGQEHARLAKLAQQTLEDNVKRLYDGLSYEKFLVDERRWIISDRVDVRKIDSVYRNRDAGKARRGELVLDKVWAEGDTLLQEVAAA